MSWGYGKPQKNDFPLLFPLLFLQDTLYYFFLNLIALQMMGKGWPVQSKLEVITAIFFVQQKSCSLKLLETTNVFSLHWFEQAREGLLWQSFHGGSREVTTWNLVISFVEKSICLVVVWCWQEITDDKSFHTSPVRLRIVMKW